MHLIRPSSLRALLASLAFAPFMLAQTFPALPSTRPAPPVHVPTPAMQAPQAPASQQPRRARVELVGDRLVIAAENSSLNQILRDVARLTGIKITGGVTDERVFGSYGPADPSSILEALLSGTGSNMLLLKDTQHSPRELLLTPRQGGPTPPNPSLTRSAEADPDDDPDLPPQLSNRGDRSRPNQSPAALRQELLSRPNQDVPPVGAGTSSALPFTQQVPQPSPDPTSDTTTPQSPNGVKTPQQIFDQLLKMRQGRPQPPPTDAPPNQTPPE